MDEARNVAADMNNGSFFLDSVAIPVVFLPPLYGICSDRVDTRTRGVSTWSIRAGLGSRTSGCLLTLATHRSRG